MNDPSATTRLDHPRWMSVVLLAAAVYNLIWGAAVILLPAPTLGLIGLGDANYPQLWQCIGMIVGVYGIGYAIAAGDPARHWPIVLVGLLGKVLGPIGFVSGLTGGDLPLRMGWTILTNDLVWWLPFAAILWHAWDRAMRPAAADASDPMRGAATLAEALGRAATSRGATLGELSDQRPTLMVFLRHLGCTFCRTTLADLSRDRAAIERQGRGIAVIHLGPGDEAQSLLERYALGDLPHLADPSAELYRRFELRRGSFPALFGPRVWLRAGPALLRGHGIGPLRGDGFQMPGAFLVHRGRVLAAYRHRSAADRPDHLALAACSLDAEGHGQPANSSVRPDPAPQVPEAPAHPARPKPATP